MDVNQAAFDVIFIQYVSGCQGFAFDKRSEWYD